MSAARLAHGWLVDIWHGIVAVFRRVPGVEMAGEGLGALVEEMAEWLLDVAFPLVSVLAIGAGMAFGLGFLLHLGWAAL